MEAGYLTSGFLRQICVLFNLGEINDKILKNNLVTNPINNYGVNINIGDYVRFSEVYKGEKGDLDIDNYVLSYNLS